MSSKEYEFIRELSKFETVRDAFSWQISNGNYTDSMPPAEAAIWFLFPCRDDRARAGTFLGLDYIF